MRRGLLHLLLAILLASSAIGAADITITVNDHLSCSGSFYTGMTNYVNFHIENDQPIQGMTLGFEFSGYSGTLQWQNVGDLADCTGDCYFEVGCRAQGAFDLLTDEESRSFDGSLPDSIMVFGAAISSPLPVGTATDVVYRLSVFIPAGEPAGTISIDNVIFPPTADWSATDGGGSFAPDYFGCVNTSTTNPDCPAIDFPVTATICGDVNTSGSLGVDDIAALTNWLNQMGPEPCPPKFADVTGDCTLDSLDLVLLQDMIFGGGTGVCTCEVAVPVCDQGTICTNSTTDPVLVLCPGGDAAFNVYLRDASDNPVVGESSVWIEFVNCTDVDTCPGGTEIVRLDPVAPSDAEGKLTFFGAGGGCNLACEADVKASCGTIATVPVRSVDINGDMGVSLAFDFDFSECNNYDGVSGIQFADQNLFNDHVGHFCGLSPCERFNATFSLDPPSNLAPGQLVDLTLLLENNNFSSCAIGFIGFFSSGFGTGGAPQLIENVSYNQSLTPGGSDTVTISYMVPGEGHGCLSVEFTTDCCGTTTVLEECAQSTWHCGGDGGLCYDVFIRLDGDPVENIVLPTTYLAPGWFINEVYVPTTFPLVGTDSILYQICTPVDGQLGDDSRVPVEVWYDATGTNVEIFESQVFITPRTGDADGNCQVSIGDAVYVINYIFASGPAPVPCQAGDVNCGGEISISDAVYIVNFIFGGGPPPCIPDEATPEPTCL